MVDERVAHLVVDSGAFIRNAPISTIGRDVFTLPEVVREIRDKTTRQRLQVLPYELKFRQPSSESIHVVTEFCKKTGDYRSLSAVDIKLMALAYQLEKEHVGTEHLKTEPNRNISWNATRRHLEKPTEIAGFYLEKRADKSEQENKDETNTDNELAKKMEDAKLDAGENVTEGTLEQKEVVVNNQNEADDTKENHSPPAETDQKSEEEEHVSIRADQIGDDDSSEDEEEEEEDEDDDDDGWITPSNIKQVKASMGGVNEQKAAVAVGCITMDFAMQNVLLQMGLNVVSVDGMLIKKAKSYVLWCGTCYKTSPDMTKEFCYKCGHKNLRKIAMSINEDGSIQYHFSKRKPMSTRGLRYSLPTPKGGKYATNPILCADQKVAQHRMSERSKIKYDPFDPDFSAHNSPFAPTDVHSKSAQLGFRNHNNGFRNKRNPNENKKVYGRRK